MKLTELFTKLALAELQGSKHVEDGAVLETSKAKLTLFVNDALIKLYTRFVLKKSELLLEMNEWTTNYHLIPRFAVQYVPESEEDDEPIRYILDLPLEPQKDDVLRVLSVFDSNGKELPLNDQNKFGSVFTPEDKVLQVPSPEAEKSLAVTYQARHQELVYSDDDEWEDPEVKFPWHLDEALRSYVAYKVFSGTNSDKSNPKAQEMLALYEGICSDNEAKDISSQSAHPTNTKFEDRGFF